MSIKDSLPSISDLINSPLSKYITLAANDCGYDGTAEELIVSYVHPLFLCAHLAASKLDNPGWRKATQGKFANDYWKAMELEIFTLESIKAWKVIDWEDNMNVIRSTWAFKCNILIVLLRNSKPGSVLEETSNWKELISLRLMPQ